MGTSRVLSLPWGKTVEKWPWKLLGLLLRPNEGVLRRPAPARALPANLAMALDGAF